MAEHDPAPDATCDGGDLDCGSGLLLIIRNAMDPLPSGGVLEVRSREISVKEDLPAWCRLVGHDMFASRPGESGSTSYFIRKKSADAVLKQDLDQARNYVWRARVRGRGGMGAEVFVRNHSFAAGQPVSFDTADQAISAIEYLIGSLGACLAVGFQWRASQRGIKVHNLEVALQARAQDILVYLGLRDAGNPGLADVRATVYVDADADLEVLEDLLAETVRRSPVTQTLQHAVSFTAELRKA
ncbi:MAG TPA: OsmC family protein [Candidatus Acidoferrales bacterium]|nr:OsmC family protein [Candidatus Acidoferrales bacterium]